MNLEEVSPQFPATVGAEIHTQIAAQSVPDEVCRFNGTSAAAVRSIVEYCRLHGVVVSFNFQL